MINFSYLIIYLNFRCSTKKVFAIKSSYNFKESLVESEKVILVITDKKICFDHNTQFPFVKTVTDCIRHLKINSKIKYLVNNFNFYVS